MTIRYLSYIYTSQFDSGALVAHARAVTSLEEAVVAQVAMAAATGWRIAKYGTCSGTLAYLSNLGNKNKARVLKTATHLGLYTSKQHSLLSSFNIADMAIM